VHRRVVAVGALRAFVSFKNSRGGPERSSCAVGSESQGTFTELKSRNVGVPAVSKLSKRVGRIDAGSGSYPVFKGPATL
jgi:hypothetical protein